MIDAKFIIKNYRCFSDEHPLEFTLRDGFTAFVGPNNSGKSFILKFFYEFRKIWNILKDENNLNNLVRGNEIGVDFTQVIDKSDVFHRFNGREIQVFIEIKDISFRFYIIKRDNVNVYLKRGEFFLKGQALSPLGGHAQIVDINTKIFHSNIGDMNIGYLLEVFDAAARAIYVPAFRNAVNIGADQEYYDISIGEAFIRAFGQWKLGYYSWQSQFIQDVTEDIKNLFEYKNLEINPSDDRKSIHLTIDGKVYKLHEVGSGIAQFILVFVNIALKKPSFILIDEPELNLHPALQQKFLTNLTAYSRNGVLFATHSLGLARSIGDLIYSVIKRGNLSIVKPLESTFNYPEFLGELSFSAFQDLGVEKILLVEGTTEMKTFQQFLRKKNKDKEFVILPLGGDSMINGKRGHELADIKRITPKIFCWIDSEKDRENGVLPKNRKAFLDLCRRLKIKAHASERRSLEHYFSEQAVEKISGEDYLMPEAYKKFDQSKYWAKEKNWRIAREMDFKEMEDTDLGKFITSI